MLHRSLPSHNDLDSALRYALKVGILFPVPAPRRGATVNELVRWGALRNLHTAIALHFRRKNEEW